MNWMLAHSAWLMSAACENKLFIALFNSLRLFLVEEIGKSNDLAPSKDRIFRQHQELSRDQIGDLSVAFSALQNHLSVIVQRLGLNETGRTTGTFWLQGVDATG